MCQSVPKKGKEMIDREALKVVLDTTLKQMRSSINEAELTKEAEVYTTRKFVIDYSSDAVEVKDIQKAIKGDEWFLSKIAGSAIYTIGQRVELESKRDTDLIAAAVKIIHANAVSTAIKTIWEATIARENGYWSFIISVYEDGRIDNTPSMVFYYRLVIEKKGD